ncbi:uncharacterized protein LOC133037362 isoform X2 [Cannabis sativa]|nr:uncharacterized protein LOC133037362 isoform X2 [Cannabis sativa]
MSVKHKTMNNWPIKDLLDNYYLLTFCMILFFTILAIGASSLVLLANQSSMKKMENLKGTILSVGGEVRRSLKHVMKAMTHMQYLLVAYDPTMASTLNTTTHRLGSESRIVQYFVDKNGQSIERAIQISYVAHIVVVATNLVLITAALVLILLHWYPAFVFLIFLCWISTTLLWVLTGFDFFLHTLAEDTCYAFKDFESNPEKSSLSTMLPCMDSSYSNKMMAQIGYIVHTFITQLNSKIPDYYKLLGFDGGVAENDYLSGFVTICNPFDGAPNYSYIPQSCPQNTIPIGHIPHVLASFTCYENDNVERCLRDGKFVSEEIYNMASAYSRSTQDILNVYPDLQSLSECKLVKDKFSYVVLNECVPFQVAVRLLWLSMLSLSVIMVVLVLIWFIKAIQDKARCFSLCSLIPRPQPRPIIHRF